MKEIIALAFTLFSAIIGLMFVFSLLPGAIQIYQGDITNGTEAIVNATANEIVSYAYESVIIAVLVAIASALGLTSLVILLKKL
jgi:hypothetical protein